MNILCKNILKLSSMISLFDKNTEDIGTEISIMTDGGIQVSNRTKKDKYSILKLIIDILYKIFVGGILIVPSIIVLYYAIINKDIKYALTNIFLILPIIQYITGIIYQQSKHFNITLKRNAQIIEHGNIIYIIPIIVSGIISIIMSILLIKKKNLSVFSKIMGKYGIVEKVLVTLFTTIHFFYSYIIILTNFIIFGITFILHYNNISKYHTTLTDHFNTKSTIIPLDGITKEHSEIKSYHADSVNKFNNIFSTLTIIGFIGSYYTIAYYNTSYIGIYDYIYTGTFFLIELMYIYIIHRVKQIVSDILKLMSSEKIIHIYLTKRVIYNNEETDNEFSMEKTVTELKKISNDIFINVIENSRNLSWQILKETLSESWESFTVCGFEIDDATIINKLVAIIVGVLMILNVGNIF